MYEAFYHLNQNPFQINTDPKFLWLGEKHKEALATLRYGVLGNKSFLLLTGDVGTGKTTLINALVKGQGKDVVGANIQDPALSSLDLFNYIAHAFGMGKSYPTKGAFLIGFREFLSECYYKGKKVLLIVDEAQRVTHQVLDDIRVLSNIEIDGNKLMTIYFIGQNEFNEILMRPENNAIRQRIAVFYNIPPLAEKEVQKYIEYRLAVSGVKKRIFEKDAVKAIHQFTEGRPRLINILCDRALLTGFVRGVKTINKSIICESFNEIDIGLLPKSSGNFGNTRSDNLLNDEADSRRRLPKRKGLALVVVLVLISVGGVYFNHESLLIQRAKSLPLILNEKIKGEVDSPLVHEEVPVVTMPAMEARPQAKDAPALVAFEAKQEAIISGVQLAPKQFARKMEIPFAANSITPAPEYFDELKMFIDNFKQLKDARIVIRGFTDKSGSAQYNKKLAQFRANAIHYFLAGRGVDMAKVVTAQDAEKGLESKDARLVELEIIVPSSAQKTGSPL